MATDPKTSFSDAMRQAQALLASPPMMAPQAEQFWKAQDDILKETEAYWKAWFDRRHQATKSAAEAMQKMNADTQDPAAAMQAMADWQRHSLERVVEDMQQWVDLCSRCTGRLAEADVVAGKEAIEEVEKRTKPAAKSKHATPV